MITALALLAASTSTGPWPTYVNVHYGFAVCYPADVLRPAPEAPSGDGRAFAARDGAQLIVSGSYDQDGTGVANSMQDNANLRIGAGATITYNARGRNWAAISGVQRGSIFYEKALQRDDRIISLVFTYPRGKADFYKPIVARMSRCFGVGTAPF